MCFVVHDDDDDDDYLLYFNHFRDVRQILKKLSATVPWIVSTQMNVLS